MIATVLVTGATGLLGRSLCPALIAQGFRIVRHGNHNGEADVHSDLTDATTVQALVAQIDPQCIVNLVAATHVDRCEDEPDWAKRLNVAVPANLATVAVNRRVIHLSSDMVYSGVGPHLEARTNPVNVYARTKLEGETPVMETGGVVLRTNFFGRSQLSGRPSFSDTIVASLRRGERYNAFEDVMFNPLAMATLSKAIAAVCASSASGVFNLGATTAMSKYEFATAVARRFKLDEKLVCRDRLADRSGLVARPLDMRMDVTKFANSFSFALPEVEEEIAALEPNDA